MQNDFEVVDRQWVADRTEADGIARHLAPAAKHRGMVVGVRSAGPGQGFFVSVERPWCPVGCGCRLGPDARGNYDADVRECGCDGACTAQ